MGYALIWIEGMAAMLLLLALTAACSARWSSRFRRLFLPLMTALAVLVVSSLLTYGTAWEKFHFHHLVPHDWFFYTLSWTLVFLAGVGALFWYGLRRMGAERISPALSWPRGRLLLALAGMAILFAITLSNMDLAMKVQLVEARAEASAVLLALTPPPIADNDNAAPIYEEAFAALTPLERLPQRWKQKMETWKKREWQQAYQWDFPTRLQTHFDWRDKEWKEFLHSQDRALTLLRKAASKPACRFPHSDPLTFFDGSAWRYSPESNFSQAAQRLALDARVQATAGDTHTAVDDIVALLGIARHTADGAVEKEAWETLADVLHLSAPKADDLARLSHVEGEPYLRQFPKIQAEFALRSLVMLSAEFSSHWFWDMTKEVPFLHRKGHPMPEGYEAPFWFEATIMPVWRVFLGPDELLVIHRSLKTCQDSLHNPESQTFADWREVQQLLNRQEGGWFFFGDLRTRLEARVLWACDITALRRLSHLAIALTAYKAKHCRFADKLEDLMPAFLNRLPTDPWDGGRLHMKRTEKGILLYTHRNDTKEPILSPNNATRRRDIIFRMEPGTVATNHTNRKNKRQE